MALDALTGFDFDEAAGTMDEEKQREADKHLYVKFYKRPVLDQLLTEGGLISKRHPRVKELQKQGAELAQNENEDVGKDWRNYLVLEPAGRPVYREVEFVTIMRPGDRDSILDVELSDAYRRRFAARYDQWKKGVVGEGIVGTPLVELPFVRSDVREELAFFGIFTAEQLAEAPDAAMQKIRGLRTLQQRVQRWLEGASGNVHVEKLNREMNEKDAAIAALQQAVEQLKAQLGARGESPSELSDEPDDAPPPRRTKRPARRPARRAPRMREVPAEG